MAPSSLPDGRRAVSLRARGKARRAAGPRPGRSESSFRPGAAASLSARGKAQGAVSRSLRAASYAEPPARSAGSVVSARRGRRLQAGRRRAGVDDWSRPAAGPRGRRVCVCVCGGGAGCGHERGARSSRAAATRAAATRAAATRTSPRPIPAVQPRPPSAPPPPAIAGRGRSLPCRPPRARASARRRPRPPPPPPPLPTTPPAPHSASGGGAPARATAAPARAGSALDGEALEALHPGEVLEVLHEGLEAPAAGAGRLSSGP